MSTRSQWALWWSMAAAGSVVLGSSDEQARAARQPSQRGRDVVSIRSKALANPVCGTGGLLHEALFLEGAIEQLARFTGEAKRTCVCQSCTGPGCMLRGEMLFSFIIISSVLLLLYTCALSQAGQRAASPMCSSCGSSVHVGSIHNAEFTIHDSRFEFGAFAVTSPVPPCAQD